MKGSGCFYTARPWETCARAYGINNLGQVVGHFQAATGVVFGFLYSDGVFTKLNYTWPTGINDAGHLLGPDGFYADGVFNPRAESLDFATLSGINNSDEIVGYVAAPSCASRGCARSFKVRGDGGVLWIDYETHGPLTPTHLARSVRPLSSSITPE